MELAQQQIELEQPAASTLDTDSAHDLACQATAVPEAVSRIAAGIAAHRRLYRLLAVVPAAIVTPLVIGLVFLVRAALGTDAFLHWITQPLNLLSVLGSLAVTPAVIAIGIRNAARRLESLSGELTQQDDVALVGPLIDLLAVDNTVVRRNAARALTELLPRMTAEDGERLTSAQRERLIRRVAMNPDYFLYKDVNKLFRPPELDRDANVAAVDFRVAALRSYATIGGAMELSAVRRIANSTSPNPAQKRMREAARESLPPLEARLKEQSRHSRLLRPSSEPDSTSDLLMPVDTGASPSDNLLRPAGD